MNTPQAHLVDDDEAIRDALSWLLKSRGIPSPSSWMRIPIRAKLTGLVLWLIAAQVFGTAFSLLGPSLGVSRDTTGLVMEVLGVSGVVAGVYVQAISAFAPVAPSAVKL